MSILGTSVAAGVAQTGLTAQQTGRRRDRRTHEQQRSARRLREVLEIQLDGLEEEEADQTVTRPRIDGDPDPRHRRRDPHQQELFHHAAGGLPPVPDPYHPSRGMSPPPEPSSSAAVAAYARMAAPPPEAPLYRHLDVEG